MPTLDFAELPKHGPFRLQDGFGFKTVDQVVVLSSQDGRRIVLLRAEGHPLAL